jgi:threonine dehydrogenase-like Zn-dependent dehydrogenase
MSIPTVRTVVSQQGDGHLRAIEMAIPKLRPGQVAIETAASLVSPGTEFGGWRGLAAQRESPQRRDQPQTFGYSCTGVVVGVAEDVQSLHKGDRVAAIGAGYALHSSFNLVPHNLCTRLPDDVSFEDGAFAMLAATAMHAVRRAALGFGEYACVVGLGPVGLLTAMLLKLGGQYVIGWDPVQSRCDISRRLGIDNAVLPGHDAEEATMTFSGGNGLDGAVLAFGGEGSEVVKSLVGCMKRSPDGHPCGVITVVGHPRFAYRDIESSGMSNIDLRRASRTGAGYHDLPWETGTDYPPVFMRWTTRTNLELCMRLIGEGRLNVGSSITHRVHVDSVDEQTQDMLDSPDEILNVIIDYRR